MNKTQEKAGKSGTTKKDAIDGVDNNMLSTTSSVGGNNQTMPNLAAYKEKRESDAEKAKEKTKKRGRPRKKATVAEPPPQMSKMEAQVFLRPMFDFASAIMVARGVQEFSEQEVNTGIDAWLPILNKYMPAMGDFAIWIPPIMWTGGVVMARMPKKLEPKGQLPLASEPEKENSHDGNKTDAKT